MTQTDEVLEYLKAHPIGGISQREAADLFGCYRLSARIAELREAGYRIDTDYETGKNRFGDKVTYGRYRLRTDK